MILPLIFHLNASARRVLPNRWDFVAFPLFISVIVLFGTGFQQTLAPLSSLHHQEISLDPVYLPQYALRTVLRMLVAMGVALIFTLLYGTLAAKSQRAQMVLVPLLDILQSVPVLGYISFSVVIFLAWFPGRVLGAECAAIFAIFTAQAWNMTFSFYQSLRTVPSDLLEVAKSFRLSPWQQFWKLEVPFAMPGLVWNMMMSMSGGWFFIVASEVITVGHRTVILPGIGAYLSQAILERDIGAVGLVVVTMTAVILVYDQCLFRPLVAWADKFRMDNTSASTAPQSWLLDVLRRTRLVGRLLYPFALGLRFIAQQPLRLPRQVSKMGDQVAAWNPVLDKLWPLTLLAGTCYLTWQVGRFIAPSLDLFDVLTVLGLGLITLLRVLLLIGLASLIWVPVGVYIGLRPALAEKIQPLAQFLAAFPANVFFPLFVIAIAHFHANTDIWLSPLIILGSQWYILFNVIAGASIFPNDFLEAARNFRIRGWQWWRQVILPGIFPYYVTGAITASGAAWNASIVSEYVSWGEVHLVAHGLGAYLAQMTIAGEYPKIILGLMTMSLFVILFNRLLWRPLYVYAENRLR